MLAMPLTAWYGSACAVCRHTAQASQATLQVRIPASAAQPPAPDTTVHFPQRNVNAAHRSVAWGPRVFQQGFPEHEEAAAVAHDT